MTLPNCSSHQEEGISASELDIEQKNEIESPFKTALLPQLSAGINRKASPWELHSWVSLALTLDGRDKLTKLLQYSARMVAWWCEKRNLNTAYVLRFKALQSSLTRSRKAYRLGRSFIEVDKLRSVGIMALLSWHIRRSWNRSTREERPVNAPAWKVVGSSLKILGLLAFWACDNVTFLASSGFLDDYSLGESHRLSQRKDLVSTAAKTATRSYFLGSISGLFVSLRSYWTYLREELRVVQDQAEQEHSEGAVSEETRLALEKARQKQFDLFLPLLKSVCDVLVFSNNPGVDLHKRFRGKTMHEGLHCVCGLISASTVLYNNYPSSKSLKR